MEEGYHASSLIKSTGESESFCLHVLKSKHTRFCSKNTTTNIRCCV
ncbi:hypothetical protein C5167_047297 [Papaver somniferum]|uniref:Uncharacterized protein n=1 Tax=Papaver somniferum TaxID=3469 RepID=A0A4Y7LG85_PAPSO|nr:hypothetical protein C5167_047297 [Papaver somniferum]